MLRDSVACWIEKPLMIKQKNYYKVHKSQLYKSHLNNNEHRNQLSQHSYDCCDMKRKIPQGQKSTKIP